MTARPCHDCGVEPGQPHVHGCDVARCLNCGSQAISCDCPEDVLGDDVWTGEFPGVEDCRRLGFWCYWDDDAPAGRKWVRCGPEHPGAGPDLNRLLVSEARGEARWDRGTQRWEATSR